MLYKGAAPLLIYLNDLSCFLPYVLQCHKYGYLTFIMAWKDAHTVTYESCMWIEWSQLAAHSLFTRKHLLQLRPLLLQLAEPLAEIRAHLRFLSDCSHRDRCLCCHGKPQNLSGCGLDLLIQLPAGLWWLGVSSVVLQPLTGGERSWTEMKYLCRTCNTDDCVRLCFQLVTVFSPSPVPAAFLRFSVCSTLCNLGKGNTHTHTHTHTFFHQYYSNEHISTVVFHP